MNNTKITRGGGEKRKERREKMAEEIIAAGHATRFSFFRELSSDLRYDDEFFFLSFRFKHEARNFFSIIFLLQKRYYNWEGKGEFFEF